jgi:hypothetical protein
MKLGTQTGSLINHVLTHNVMPTVPEVGAPATICMWTDRDPATVFRTFAVGKAVIVETRDDKAARIDTNGISESQRYEYKTDVLGAKRYWRVTDKGIEHVYLAESGRWKKASSLGVRFGVREKFHDYSF